MLELSSCPGHDWGERKEEKFPPPMSPCHGLSPLSPCTAMDIPTWLELACEEAVPEYVQGGVRGEDWGPGKPLPSTSPCASFPCLCRTLPSSQPWAFPSPGSWLLTSLAPGATCPSSGPWRSWPHPLGLESAHIKTFSRN